jgi:hypothetical protein
MPCRPTDDLHSLVKPSIARALHQAQISKFCQRCVKMRERDTFWFWGGLRISISRFILSRRFNYSIIVADLLLFAFAFPVRTCFRLRRCLFLCLAFGCFSLSVYAASAIKQPIPERHPQIHNIDLSARLAKKSVQDSCRLSRSHTRAAFTAEVVCR